MVKTHGSFGIVAACAVLASCLVMSGCVAVMEGTVRVKDSNGSSGSSVRPAPGPQRVQPAPQPQKAPQPKKKSPPKTVYEKKNLTLALGKTYAVTAPVNHSAGLLAECWTSNPGVVALDSETMIGSSGKGSGTAKYVFKAVAGGSAVVTYKKIQNGHILLVREIRITVPMPQKQKSKGSVGFRSAAQ